MKLLPTLFLTLPLCSLAAPIVLTRREPMENSGNDRPPSPSSYDYYAFRGPHRPPSPSTYDYYSYCPLLLQTTNHPPPTHLNGQTWYPTHPATNTPHDTRLPSHQNPQHQSPLQSQGACPSPQELGAGQHSNSNPAAHPFPSQNPQTQSPRTRTPQGSSPMALEGTESGPSPSPGTKAPRKPRKPSIRVGKTKVAKTPSVKISQRTWPKIHRVVIAPPDQHREEWPPGMFDRVVTPFIKEVEKLNTEVERWIGLWRSKTTTRLTTGEATMRKVLEHALEAEVLLGKLKADPEYASASVMAEQSKFRTHQLKHDRSSEMDGTSERLKTMVKALKAWDLQSK